MKTYFNADAEKSNPQNIVKGEAITSPPLNVPVFLVHDIFFADDILLYTDPKNKTGSALVSGRDYELSLQDTIASEQSNRHCFRSVLFTTLFPVVYADYHAYGDLVQAETINDIQDQASHAVNVAEETAENLADHKETKNVHGATTEESGETLMIRRKDGSVSVGKPVKQNDVARLSEIEGEADSRATADQNLQNQLDAEIIDRTEMDEALRADLSAHTADQENPHSVTATQVGLGNVPNVATNDQTPTYTAADSEQNLSSGEKLTIAFGKIAKVVQSFITHISSNLVHGATANDVAGTLMARSATGTTEVAAPMNDSDAVNKKFVTDLLAGIGVNDVHALSENITAKIWHNGKAVYRKGFYVSTLPNTTVSETAFNISGLTYITNLFGVAVEKTTKAKLMLPHPLVSLRPVSADTKFRIKTGKNRSNWEAYVFVEYTK